MPGLALYQPDIAQNCGAMMRLCAALGVSMDIIEPCGFVLDDQKLRRAAMDYIQYLSLTRHASWDKFRQYAGGRRLVLLTTRGAVPYTEVSYHADDLLMVGRESAGVPEDVHEASALRVFIPLRPPARSLNVAMSAAIVIAEALRQIGDRAASSSL